MSTITVTLQLELSSELDILRNALHITPTPCMPVGMGWVGSWCGLLDGFADLRSVLEMSHVMHCNGCAEYRPCTMKTYYTESGTDFLWLCEECYDKYGWLRYMDFDVDVDAVMLMFEPRDRELTNLSGISLDELEGWFWLCNSVVETMFMIQWFLSGCIWCVQRSQQAPYDRVWMRYYNSV